MTVAPAAVSRAVPALTTAQVASRRRARWIWPMAIVGLLLMNAVIVAITVVAAIGDPSAAVEPDYYAKALAFEGTIKQRATNATLGWTAEPTLRTTADARATELLVRLADRDRKPLSGAHLTITAFPSARAAERQTLTALAVQPGEYTASVRITRGGIWIIRIVATLGDDTFTREADLIVPLMNP